MYKQFIFNKMSTSKWQRICFDFKICSLYNIKFGQSVVVPRRQTEMSKLFIGSSLTHNWIPVIPPRAMFPILSTPRPKQNGRHFAGDIYKYIFVSGIFLYFDEDFILSHKPSLQWAILSEVMGWHRRSDKPLPEPIMMMHMYQYLTDVLFSKAYLCDYLFFSSTLWIGLQFVDAVWF